MNKVLKYNEIFKNGKTIQTRMSAIESLGFSADLSF